MKGASRIAFGEAFAKDNYSFYTIHYAKETCMTFAIELKKI